MTTLAQYLEDSSAQPGVAQTVLALGEAALVISGLLRYRGMASVSPTGINVQGETQKPKDVFSNNEIIERLAAVPLVQCGLKIPGHGAEDAVNTSRRHYWDAPFLKAVEHLELGKEGFFGRQLSMRWTGSMVADVHRVLTRGGLFMYPVDSGNEVSGGRLRLLYEGLPIALIIENAGGLATDGRKRLLEIDVTHPHQRVGLIFGSRLDALNFAVLVQQP